MNRREFVREITNVLRENGSKKPMRVDKQVFHITDDAGNHRDFTIKGSDKSAIYTINDIDVMVDAAISVIEDMLKHGEKLNLQGIGTLGVKYRKPVKRKNGLTGLDDEISGRYVPKLVFGRELRRAARLYGMSIDDKLNVPEPVYDEDDIVEDGE